MGITISLETSEVIPHTNAMMGIRTPFTHLLRELSSISGLFDLVMKISSKADQPHASPAPRLAAVTRRVPATKQISTIPARVTPRKRVRRQGAVIAPAAINNAPSKYNVPEYEIGVNNASAVSRLTGKISIAPAVNRRRRMIMPAESPR
jgi:hypothetical protein